MPSGGRTACRLLLSALFILGMAAPRALASEVQPLNPRVHIRINSPGVVGLAPLYLALDRGYFAAEGLDVEIANGVAARGGMDIVTQLTGGGLDIATIAPSSGLFDTLLRGAPLKGLFVMNTITASDASSGIVVRQDHIASGRYRTAKDLKGMKIAVQALGGSAHYNVVRALQQAGLAPGDVEFVAMPFADGLAALTGSTVDAAFEVEPFISTAQARGVARLVIPASETSRGAPSVMVYANATFVANNRVAVERYIHALLRGQRDYYAAVTTSAGRDDLFAVLIKYTALKDLAQLKQMSLPTVDPNGAFDLKAMNELQAFFVQTGGLQRPLTEGEIIDTRFTTAAAKRLDRDN